MKELGISEDILCTDSPKNKGDVYGRGGGKKAWMGKYHGSGKRFNLRDRRNSSSFRYDRNSSRSPSPSSNYKTQALGHLELVPKTEVGESQEHPISSGYSLRSGDSLERPSSQASNYSSQSGVTEESVERSLSQNSRGSRDSVSDRKRKPPSSELRSRNRLRSRRYYESDSDDASSKERDSSGRTRRTSRYESNTHSSRYSQLSNKHGSKRMLGQLADRSSESDSKEREREENDRREQWKRYHRNRRCRESPRRSRGKRVRSDEETQAQRYDTSESDGQMAGHVHVSALKSSSTIPLQKLSGQPQTSTEGGSIPVDAETPLDASTHQVQEMDLDTSHDNSPELPENSHPIKPFVTIKNETQLAYDSLECCDQMDAHADNQLDKPPDTQQSEPQSHLLAIPSNSPSSVFHFERDETPPAEIVEATAEWYRTQNIPPNFDSIPLQHVFQYYQSSMVTGDSKKDDKVWHNPEWPTASLKHQEGQQQNNPAPSPHTVVTCGNPSTSITGLDKNNIQNVHLIADHCTKLHPDVKCTVTDVSEESGDTSFPTVQLGVTGVKFNSNNDDRDSNKWTNNEVKQQLQMFLEEAKLRAQESSTSKSAADSREETVPFSRDIESSRESVAEQINAGRWCQQKESKASPYSDTKSRKSYERDEPPPSGYSASQSRDIAYLNIGSSSHATLDHPTKYSYGEYSGCQTPSNYSVEGRVPAVFSSNNPSTLQYIPPPLEQAIPSVFEKEVDLRSKPTKMVTRPIQPVNENLGDHSKEEDRRKKEIWSRDSATLRREGVSDLPEWMEACDSGRYTCRPEKADPSWTGDVRRSREIAVDEHRFPKHPNSPGVYQTPCDKEFQTSELPRVNQPFGREHQFQQYSVTGVTSEIEHRHHPTKLSGEESNNVIIPENEDVRHFHERVIDQLPAPRNQCEQDQFQMMLDRELEERALEEEAAKRREESLEGDGPYAYTTFSKEQTQSAIVELSHSQSADKATESMQCDATKEVQVVPNKNKTKLSKYRQLQKSYYKVKD